MATNTNSPTLALQDGTDTILLTHAPRLGCIHLKTVDKHGFTKRRDILDFEEHPEFECLHTERGWYYPLVGRVLELYAGYTLTAKGRGRKVACVQYKHRAMPMPPFVARHYGGNKNGQNPV